MRDRAFCFVFNWGGLVLNRGGGCCAPAGMGGAALKPGRWGDPKKMHHRIALKPGRNRL